MRQRHRRNGSKKDCECCKGGRPGQTRMEADRADHHRDGCHRRHLSYSAPGHQSAPRVGLGCLSNPQEPALWAAVPHHGQTRRPLARRLAAADGQAEASAPLHVQRSCTEVSVTSSAAQSSHMRVGEGQRRAVRWCNSTPGPRNLHSPTGRRPPQVALGAATGRANSAGIAHIAARAGWGVVATARQALEAG